jgi:hypothetical protein
MLMCRHFIPHELLPSSFFKVSFSHTEESNILKFNQIYIGNY